MVIRDHSCSKTAIKSAIRLASVGAIALLTSCTGAFTPSSVGKELSAPDPIEMPIWVDRVQQGSALIVSQLAESGTDTSEEFDVLDGLDAGLIADGAEFSLTFPAESTEECQYVIRYPKVSGLADAATQENLNARLRQTIVDKVEQLSRRYQDFLPTDIDSRLLEGDRCTDVEDSDLRKMLDFWIRMPRCEIHFAKASLISLHCSRYTLPGAYPSFHNFGLTFDLDTGEIFQISDLFEPDSNYDVRLAVAMRDALWESFENVNYAMSEYPLTTLEDPNSINQLEFYFVEGCDRIRVWRPEDSLPFSSVCMHVMNLGSGASRNYVMQVDISQLVELFDQDSGLTVIQEMLNEET